MTSILTSEKQLYIYLTRGDTVTCKLLSVKPCPAEIARLQQVDLCGRNAYTDVGYRIVNVYTVL